MRFCSPAKLNLFFHVLRKRSDDYHEISSRYQAIDLFDFLDLKISDIDLLTSSDPFLDCGPSNLVLRALTLFRSRFPDTPYFRIHLEKHIPIQAGLGGGSSNGATTLWAVNLLSKSPATLADLIAMGSELGSDVPFFFSSGSALCTSRGDIFQSVPFAPLSGWIAKPKVGLSTPLVYQHLLPSDWLSPAMNHLEAPAFRLEPSLAEIKRTLEEKTKDEVVMTGSGTAFFGFGAMPLPIEGVDLISFQAVQRSDWYAPKED
jgi:4-diphosphocytidyl-2-C-methyl-D-erythritol kinase